MVYKENPSSIQDQQPSHHQELYVDCQLEGEDELEPLCVTFQIEISEREMENVLNA